jgi:hypothetical protein
MKSPPLGKTIFFVKANFIRASIQALARDAWYAYFKNLPPILGLASILRLGGVKNDQNIRFPGGGGTQAHIWPSIKENLRLILNGILQQKSKQY